MMAKNLFLSSGIAIFHHNLHGANEEQMMSRLKNVFQREEELLEKETHPLEQKELVQQSTKAAFLTPDPFLHNIILYVPMRYEVNILIV